MDIASDVSGQVQANINVTPLVDVLLVLLIIFMVITPIMPKGVDAQIPQDPKKEQPAAPERTVVAEIDQEGGGISIRINRQPVAWSELSPLLADIYKTRAERVLFLRAGDEVEFQNIARVLDAANGTHLGISVGLLPRQMH